MLKKLNLIEYLVLSVMCSIPILFIIIWISKLPGLPSVNNEMQKINYIGNLYTNSNSISTGLADKYYLDILNKKNFLSFSDKKTKYVYRIKRNNDFFKINISNVNNKECLSFYEEQNAVVNNKQQFYFNDKIIEKNTLETDYKTEKINRKNAINACKNKENNINIVFKV